MLPFIKVPLGRVIIKCVSQAANKRLGHRSPPALLSGPLSKKKLLLWNKGDQLSSPSNAGYYDCSLGFYGNQHWPSYESFVSRPLNNFSANKAKEWRPVSGNFSFILLNWRSSAGSLLKCRRALQKYEALFFLCHSAAIIAIIPFYSAFSASFSRSKSAQMGPTSTTSSPALWFLPWPTSSASPMSHLKHFCPCLHH